MHGHENRAGHAEFRSHLIGRIAWVEQLNPARGRKLRERFAAIDWDA
jgi:RNA-directed DNA polymerase